MTSVWVLLIFYRFGIYIAAVALAAIRLSGHTSEAYQAVAHLFVGGLFTAAFYEWQNKATLLEAKQKFQVGVALSLLELACFLWFKFGGLS